MAEVNQGFEAALRRGREFGAAGDWAKALTEFIRAAQIAPQDIAARYNLAVALLNLQQYDQAMQQFQGIVRIQTQNTDAWQRIAEIQHLTGNTPDAVQTYQRIKDIHKKNERTREVAEILREIIKIDPAQVGAYRELIEMVKLRGDRKTAAGLVLDLAHYHQSQGQTKEAQAALSEALLLQPGMPEAESLKQELNGGGNNSVAGLSELPNLTVMNGLEGSSSQPWPANPSDMIASVSQADFTINTLIAEAEEALSRGETGLALRNYQQAVEAGANRSDVFYSLGNLYADIGDTDHAAEYLRRSAEDHDYAASAFFGMGQVYSAANRLEEAANAYQDALNLIDIQTIGREEVDELVDMYEALGEILVKQGKESEAAALYNKLVAFINGKNLRTDKTAVALIKAREINEKIRPATGPALILADEEEEPITSSIRFGEDGISVTTSAEIGSDGEPKTNPGTTLGPIGLFAGASGSSRPVSVVATPALPARFPTKLVEFEPNPAVQPYLRASEEFIRTNRLVAATDACHEIIRYYPDYLPAQVILAEVYVAQDRLEQARLKYQFVVDLYQLRQDSVKSLECYKRLGELSPDNMGLRTKLANMLLQYDQRAEAAEILLTTIGNFISTGQLERALEECKKLRSLAPSSAPIRVQYAELLNRLDRHSEALPELRRALELEPNNLKALAQLNITSFLLRDASLKWGSFQTVMERAKHSEDRKQLIEEYRQAGVLYLHPGLQYALGCLYLENKQAKSAHAVFDQALKAPSEDHQVAKAEFEVLFHWQLGQIYLNQNRPNEAVEELTRVAGQIEKADPAFYASSGHTYGQLPGQIQLYRKLAAAFQAQGKPEQGIKALKMVKKLMPYNREVHTELAEMYFNQGQLTEALGELGELVTHYEETGKVDQTIEVLREMAHLAPNNIGVRDKLSEVFLKRGMIEDGLKELDELAELQRKNGRLKDAVRSLQKAAETYWLMGKMEPAYELYDRIVRISPGDVEARQQLVNRYLMLGRVADAIEEQRTIAQICMQANNTKEAIAALHQVIGLSPEDSRAYFQLASILSNTNEHYQAYRLYQRILRLEPNNDKARKLMEQAYKKGLEAGQMKQEAKQ